MFSGYFFSIITRFQLFLSIFAGMKQSLSDYIKENANLRQLLLKQDGGIMRFWAEHPDKDFDVDLFEDYENQIVMDYFQANKQNRAVRSLPKDKLKNKSLDWYHQSKGSELKFIVALKSELNTIDSELYDQFLKEVEIYMVDAYKESRRRKYPDGISPLDFYNEVIEKYGPFGLSLECLERVLQEYRGHAVHIGIKHFFLANIVHPGESPEWEEVNNLQTEFDIRMFIDDFVDNGGYKKLRQAIKEIIDSGTKNLTKGKCREICCKIAEDNMMKVNQFTRWVNNESFPLKEIEEGKFTPLITPKERLWLHNIMYENTPGERGTKKLTDMGGYFSHFLSILQNIGMLWAAQLLVRGIDMKELEKKTGVIMNRRSDFLYYVDKFIDGSQRGECFIYDWPEAKKLLAKIKPIKVDKAEKATKPTLDIPPQPKYMTLKYVTHDANKELVKRQHHRVEVLFDKWKTPEVEQLDGGWGWLDASVDSNEFYKLFEGKDNKCNLKFKPDMVVLTRLLICLLNYKIPDGKKKKLLIEKQTGQSAPQIIKAHFDAKAAYDYTRIGSADSTDFKRIQESIYILDWTIPLPLIPGGSDTDYDLRDETLQLCCANIDLGIEQDADIEQAVKSGVLRKGKHT